MSDTDYPLLIPEGKYTATIKRALEPLESRTGNIIFIGFQLAVEDAGFPFQLQMRMGVTLSALFFMQESMPLWIGRKMLIQIKHKMMGGETIFPDIRFVGAYND